MVIKDLIEGYKDRTREGIILLSHLLKVDKSYIYTHIDLELDEEVIGEFKRSMEKIVNDYPIHYILGERDFMGLDFYVDEGVLIPRSDTEVLVEFLIEKSKEVKNPRILELGTGSGIISNSLGYYNKNSQVLGIEISEIAYANSIKNRDRYGLENVDFILGDLFKPLKNLGTEKFDFIVSNPPYIKRSVLDQLDRNVVDYEPHLALDGGLDGLDFYREISKKSLGYLKANGILAFEIGYDQGREVREIMEFYKFKTNIIKDIEARDRVIYGSL